MSGMGARIFLSESGVSFLIKLNRLYPCLTMQNHIYIWQKLCDYRHNVKYFAFLWGDVMGDRWLSVEEIGEYLGVSKDTVYAWISKRNMPAHRIGRLWKFKTEEVDEWVRSGGAAENGSRDNN